ncbi:MAG: hypothetical protein JO235_07420 [Chroococcidiopsidaceae cyanobacterium CP_BM_RX_35]|nr:hypothetical protein [Chroococcidiopsidaceae cyanobacterium CP_BM_RX_35]
MLQQNQKNSHNFDEPGERLLNALTQQEITQLLDALFEVLSPELQESVLTQLSPDTQQIVKQILAPAKLIEPTQVITSQPISLAKQAQIWSELWQAWDEVVWEASQEEGKYITQEAHWEPPYFDTYSFIEALEGVAKNMLPLMATAFEHQLTPAHGFASALLTAESEISRGIPDWMEITEGLHLGECLTTCLLQWEWLKVQEQGHNAFHLTQGIRECELEFWQMELNSDAVLDFFMQLSEVERRCILTGFTANRESLLWKSTLDDAHSHWHQLYLWVMQQYAPERYLDNLRVTIPQQWENGLPIMKELLAHQNYAESFAVIQETLDALLKVKQGDASWVPETSLLIATLGFYYEGEQGNIETLLGYYQQTAQGLNQSERAHALEIQQVAMAQWFNWSVMFNAFTEIPLSQPTRQALFQSWRNYVTRRSKPRTWAYGTATTVQTWWVSWLIDAIADPQKGASWFQQQITQWVAELPTDTTQLGENYARLRLLTKDLTENQSEGRCPYPQFDQVVIRPRELLAPDDESRRNYMRQYAPVNLWEQVMDYWRKHLHHFVPKPESARKSDYTEHAHWMAALKELSPQNYETLLARWRTDHQRRSNLWKAMNQARLS